MFDLELVLCHQNPVRSFCYNGECFFLCARCTGICLGFILGALIPFISSFRIPRDWFWYALGLNALTLSISWIDTNIYRFSVGTFLGITSFHGIGSTIKHWFAIRRMRKELLWAGVLQNALDTRVSKSHSNTSATNPATK